MVSENLSDHGALHPLDCWRRRLNLTWTEVGARIGAKSATTARRYAMQPNNPGHRTPAPSIMVRIFVESRGEVQPNHFYALPALPDPAIGGQVAA